MNYRTDLVIEQNNIDIKTDKSVTEKKQFGNAVLTVLDITKEETAEKLSLKKGKYFTVEFPELGSICDDTGIINASLYALKELLGENQDNVMVVGLGNEDITPDALGPKTASKIFATRHLSKELKANLQLENLKTVSSIIPGVLGKTGIEAFDVTKAVCKSANIDAIIVIDALAAKSPERLCRTFQFTDTGISPGSGVQNARKRFSEADFKIPVIAVGMPTVIDYNAKHEKMMVTPKDIDLLTEKASCLLADILNTFLQPALDRETLRFLT